MFDCKPLIDQSGIESVYTDGGIIGRNPSPIGGTWAAIFVKNGELHAERSGVILPSDIGMDTVENNIAETIAVLVALEMLPDGWSGTLYGDNLNSIRRAEFPEKIKPIVPQFIKDRMIAARKRVSPKFVLLGGHPNLAEVEAGVRADGKPVSKWNVHADSVCCRRANDHRNHTGAKT